MSGERGNKTKISLISDFSFDYIPTNRSLFSLTVSLNVLIIYFLCLNSLKSTEFKSMDRIIEEVCNYCTYSFFTGRLLSWSASVQCSSDCGGRAEGSVWLWTQNSSALISISAICSVAAMSVKTKKIQGQCINHLTACQKWLFSCSRELKENYTFIDEFAFFQETKYLVRKITI